MHTHLYVSLVQYYVLLHAIPRGSRGSGGSIPTASCRSQQFVQLCTYTRSSQYVLGICSCNVCSYTFAKHLTYELVNFSDFLPASSTFDGLMARFVFMGE